jgi:hypothetical protein
MQRYCDEYFAQKEGLKKGSQRANSLHYQAFLDAVSPRPPKQYKLQPPEV